MDDQAPESPAASSGTTGTDAARVPPGGGRSARARLSAEQERELARLYAETRTPAAELARQFGISQTSVMRIAQRHGATRGGRGGGRGSTTTGAAARRARPRAHTAPPGTGSSARPRRRFRVRFLTEQVVEAADLRQAVARAEALGAVEISSITAE
jgi:transposase-like protein